MKEVSVFSQKTFRIGLIAMAALAISGISINLFSNDFLQIIGMAILIVSAFALIAVQIYLLYDSFAELTKKFRQRDRKPQKRRDFLLYLAAFLIPAKDRDFEIGNMIERFNKDKKRFGQKRALKLLAFDVITSACPLIKYAAGLIVRTILRTIGLYKIYKMFFR